LIAATTKKPNDILFCQKLKKKFGFKVQVVKSTKISCQMASKLLDFNDTSSSEDSELTDEEEEIAEYLAEVSGRKRRQVIVVCTQFLSVEKMAICHWP
jgi:hypothetical protein